MKSRLQLCCLCALFALPAFAAVGEQELPRATHAIETDALRLPSLRTQGSCLIRGATIHNAVGPAFVGDVLVQGGRIAKIGPALTAPEGLLVIEAAGKHLTPGVIDTHSHMAIRGAVNEGTTSVTAECRIADVIDPDDISIYRALAGGTTTVQCLHGSANTIGGQSEVLKLKWKRTADELRFAGAPQGIKFALGENPKRANWGEPGARFPASRMGVEAVLLRSFERAAEYQREAQAFETARARGEDPVPQRRDLRLEALAGVLDGSILVHSHCYRADEILMLLRTAEQFGFRVQTLQHVLEGYKVANEIAAHGAGTSTFSDWWAYKLEAFDAIPQNAALLDRKGVLSTINSDSDELVRHLTQEAGKSVRYADLDPERALALVTIHGARQLGIDVRTGSIEEGKDADLVLFDGDPLSFRSKCELTLVDGEVEFQRRDTFELAARPPEVQPLDLAPRNALSVDPQGGQPLAVTGGTVHPVSGPAIERGTVLMQDGVILAVGADLALPRNARVLDARGQHVYPGLIALDTALGVREIDSVRGSDDLGEVGGEHPDLRTSASLNPDSAHIAVTRFDGVTRAQVAPQRGSGIQGQSAVIALAGDTWESMLLLDRDSLHVRFPALSDEDEKVEDPESMRKLAGQLRDAREYARLLEAATHGGQPPLLDTRLAALAPYALGTKRIALHADNPQTILAAIDFAKREQLDVVLYGLAQGWKVAEAIGASGFQVVVEPVLGLPASNFDPYDAPYSNAALLARAGARVAIATSDTENPRHLICHAAHAVAYGLPEELGLRALTYEAARVLGLEQRLGTLEPGKIADLIIVRGELFDSTAPVTQVIIAGIEQPMTNRQTELYERYKDR